MAIIEIIGGPITHKYLMGKTKHEIADMYMRLLRETAREAKDAERWNAFKNGGGQPFGTDYVVRQFSRTYGEEESVSWIDFERAMDERIAARSGGGG